MRKYMALVTPKIQLKGKAWDSRSLARYDLSKFVSWSYSSGGIAEIQLFKNHSTDFKINWHRNSLEVKLFLHWNLLFYTKTFSLQKNPTLHGKFQGDGFFSYFHNFFYKKDFKKLFFLNIFERGCDIFLVFIMY